MKPMNCPGHCLLFASTARSYRELPMRITDLGVLHRNEASGALGGLTRVRRFQQDDAHIFCEEDQIEAEVIGCLEFMKFVYDVFGMAYKIELSTHPAKALEHYGGKWPFWLSPRQALVVPVGQNFAPNAEEVRSRLRAAGFHVDIDDSTNTLKKKIREGQLAQYNYILVVGEREQENDSVAVRNQMNEQEGDKKIEDVMVRFQNLCDTYQ